MPSSGRIVRFVIFRRFGRFFLAGIPDLRFRRYFRFRCRRLFRDGKVDELVVLLAEKHLRQLLDRDVQLRHLRGHLVERLLSRGVGFEKFNVRFRLRDDDRFEFGDIVGKMVGIIRRHESYDTRIFRWRNGNPGKMMRFFRKILSVISASDQRERIIATDRKLHPPAAARGKIFFGGAIATGRRLRESSSDRSE